MRTPERRRPASSLRYSPLIAALACAFGSTIAQSATFYVTNTASAGTGSLRDVIDQVNLQSDCATTGGHIIEFATASTVPSGPFVVGSPQPIQLEFGAPNSISCNNVELRGQDKVILEPHPFYGGSINCPLNGQPAAGLTKISDMWVRNFSYGSGICGKVHATGNSVSGNSTGFNVFGGSIIGGPALADRNIVYSNASDGIWISDGGLVENNYIGTPDGLQAFPNGTGIRSSESLGSLTIRNNLIAGNLSDGIDLSYMAGPVAIEGNTIGLDASIATALPNSTGIYVNSVSGSLTITGNVVSGNSSTGIYVIDIPSLVMQGNKVGTDASGTSALPNSFGIDAYFAYGGPIDNNVVSGNSYGGIYLYNTDLPVSNNKVGTNASGTAALQNGGNGLEIYGAIGGLVSGNTLAGNADSGVALYSSNNVAISGNKIGTDAAGNVGLANAGAGIDASYSEALTIANNVISANGSSGGVYLYNVTGTTLQGNRIGTKADGVSALSNNGPGVILESFSNALAISASDIGPKVAKVFSGNLLSDNTIAHNNGDGVLLIGSTNHDNTITGTGALQSIHSNNGKNINLDHYGGPRPNDVPDGTVGGPNNGQNRPTILAAMEDSGSTVVQFSLQSFANGSLLNDLPFNGQFEVDLYGNTASGVPAGQKWLAKVTVFTDATGNVTHTTTIPGIGHGHITATATGPYGTSEFSDTLTALVPSASIAPTNVAFGNVVIGATATSATQIEFRSNGTGDYVIDSISQGPTAPTCPATSTPVCATGDFSCSVSCTVGTPYPPLGSPTAPPSCTISGLSFHPAATGAQTTTVWICDNTATTPRAITFTGNGVPHVVTSSQSAHDFGTVSIGTQAVSPSIVVTNASSNPPATLGPLTVPAPFTIASNTCGATLAAGASCNFTVAYALTAIGTHTGNASMTVANGSPVTVALQGAGVAAPLGQLTLPSGVDLGSAVLASAPLQHAVTMKNTGNAPVTFNSITATAPFQLSHDCPASLAPSASCTANITFDPLVYGTTTGQLTVDSTASGSPHVATLLATVSGVPYGISPSSSDYGSIPVGSSSTPRAFIISNNGDTAIPLSGVSVTGPFTLASNNCGTSLGPQSSCTAEVAFAPEQPGLAEGTLTAQVGLSGAPPATSLLSGTGTQAPAVALPSAIDFGALVLGTPAVSQSVEIRNTGNAVLTFTSSVTGPFSLSGDCGLNLLPAAACNLVITFTPSAVGEFTGSLVVASNAPGGSRSIPVSARVQPVPRPDIRVDVTTVGFGDRMIGTPSAPQRVTVTNVGGVLAQLGITPPTRDFIATSQCGATLAPGASCTTDVVFMPLAVGPRINRLQFTSDAAGSPFTVDLIGRGCPPARPGRPPSCN